MHRTPWQSIKLSNKVLLKLIFINGNDNMVATPHPKFYLKYLCFATKDIPQLRVKIGNYLRIINIYNL
jgi:hypothetical protein